MLTIVGPIVTHKALATALYTFTPQEPYAAKVTRITMTGLSAADTWILADNGKELARFYEQTLGDQQLLSARCIPNTKQCWRRYCRHTHRIL